MNYLITILFSCKKKSVSAIILLMFWLHFLTNTMSGGDPDQRKASVCILLYILLAVTVVLLFYFNRLQFAHRVPLSQPSKSFRLFMAHCPLTLYPQVNRSLVRLLKPHFSLIQPLYSAPVNQSSQTSHSLYPDSSVN